MPLDLTGLIATVALPLIGAIYGCGKLVQRVLDHERRLNELEEDAEHSRSCRTKYDE